MKEGYRLLGDFIRQVDVRNTDGKEENLLGVSVQKMFIPSIAKHGWYRLYEIQGSQTGAVYLHSRYFSAWRQNWYCSSNGL